MTEDLNSLERDLEQEYARWAPRLDASPRPDLLDAVRSATRLEVLGAWLADRPAPAPSPGVLERVRAVVAAELAASSNRSRMLQRWLNSQGLGSLAAAAMLLLCVGIVWYAGALTSGVGTREGDRILAAVPESAADPILEEVQGLAAAIGDEAGLSVDAEDEDESLSDLVQEIDQLLDEPAPARGTSQLGTQNLKVIG